MTDYPNVPVGPGVPPLPRNPDGATPPATPAAPPPPTNTAGPALRIWGVFDAKTGAVALEVDSVFSVEYAGEHNVPEYPLEEGKFESYNKVKLPYSLSVKVTRGGTDDKIAKFKADLDALEESRDLLTIATPQYTHIDVNVIRVEYSRSAEKGVSLITATLRLKQIRVSVTTTFTQTAQPAGANVQDSGNVQAAPPTLEQSKAVDVFERGPDGRVLHPAG